MGIGSESRKILNIVANLAQNNIKNDGYETEIITHSRLTDLEVRNNLNELEWLHLVEEALPKPVHSEFRLWNITEKGLQELSHGDAG
jgi:hypothetical protein